jgi:hypothetical protein
MATINGQVTVNEVLILEVSGGPSISGGTPAPTGSIALDDTGKLWVKSGSLDTDWVGTIYVDSVVTVTTTHTAGAAKIILADATTAGFTISLPAATGLAGTRYSIYKKDITVNLVTIDANASETINGDLTLIMDSKSSCTLVCDGSNWFIE